MPGEGKAVCDFEAVSLHQSQKDSLHQLSSSCTFFLTMLDDLQGNLAATKKVHEVSILPNGRQWHIYLTYIVNTMVADDVMLSRHDRLLHSAAVSLAISPSWHDKIGAGGRFKNTYELLNLRALKISMLYKRVPLKFHTKYHTHTLKDVYFNNLFTGENLRALKI